MEWFLHNTCATTPCTCLAHLRLYIICILSAPNNSPPPPLLPISIEHHITHQIHLMPWYIFHDCHQSKNATNTTHWYKHSRPWMGSSPPPLITITNGVRGTIHEESKQASKLTPQDTITWFLFLFFNFFLKLIKHNINLHKIPHIRIPK